MDSSYLAGFLDGEGCLSIGRRKQRYITPTVQVTNTNRDVLVALCSAFGGKVYDKPHLDKRGTRKPIFLWTSAGQQALNIVRTALPHLIVKRKQAELMLSIKRYSTSNRDSLGRIKSTLDDAAFTENEKLIFSVRALNQRGASR